MKKMTKVILTGLVVTLGLVVMPNTTKAKTVNKISLNLTADKVRVKRPAALKKAKKVTIKNSKKTVAKAAYKKNRKDRRIVITAKKKGTATITVKCKLKNNKTKTIFYKVTVTALKKNNKKEDNKVTPDVVKPTPNITVKPTPVVSPTATPEITAVPIPMETVNPVEPTPYVAKYSYEVVEVLNKFSVYEDVPIVLYIKTDNPNPNDFDGVFGGTYVSVIGDGSSDFSYGDVSFLEQEKTTDTMINKVEGGWIVTVVFKNPGKKQVLIDELDKSGLKNVWRTVGTYEIEVKDGAAAEQEYCDKVIEEVSDDNYNADGRGEWSKLSDTDKINRLVDYITTHYAYPRNNDGAPIRYIQENVGAYWETGYADCGASNHLLRLLAEKLGYETKSKTSGSLYDGNLHITAVVTVNGEEKEFDATPTLKPFKNWDYIL